MKIAIGNDHTAWEMKLYIKKHLEDLGYEVVNFGTDTGESVDYPIYGKMVGEAVASGECDLGILFCGTGIGISMAANKVHGIRAAVCSEPFSAKMARCHNNANIIACGARVVDLDTARTIVDTFLNAEFEGGRHQRRVDQIMKIEK